jgi:hypothetical protein
MFANDEMEPGRSETPAAVPPRGGVWDGIREHAVPLLAIAFVAGVVAGTWHFFRLSGTLA